MLTWDGTVEIAAGPGERGPWQQNDSRYDYVDDPAVAIADDGRIAVAWADQRSKDLQFQVYGAGDGRPMGEPLNLSRSPATFSWLPRLLFSPGEPRRLYALWQEIIFSGGSHGGDILFARSDDGGASFSAPRNLSNSIGGDGKGRINRDVWHNGSLDLAAGADGAVFAAWSEYDGALWLAVSGDGGASFTEPRRIGGSSRAPARAPSLAIGPDRTLYIAWTIGESRSADIHLSRSTDGGATFTEPQLVARTGGYSDAPKLAVDPTKGTLHLAFAESPGGPFAEAHVLYTRSTDGARSFEAPRKLSDKGAAFPSLEADALGNVYVLWESMKRGQQPRGLAMAVSRDGGKRFSAPAEVPSSSDPSGGANGSRQGLLMKKLAVSPRGAVAIVNSSLKEGERSRVWLMRGAL